MRRRERALHEDAALSHIAREAEARLAARRAARAEAREIRLRELERQQREAAIDDRTDSGSYTSLSKPVSPLSTPRSSTFLRTSSSGSLFEDGSYSGLLRHHSSRPPSEPSFYLGSRASSRTSSSRASPVMDDRNERDFGDMTRSGSLYRPSGPGLSAATLASLGGLGSSRRGSTDTSFSIDSEPSVRDLRESLAEVEEKYRRTMLSNAQLDNEKAHLAYQVELLRDTLEDMEEHMAVKKKEQNILNQELSRHRQSEALLKHKNAELQENLGQQDVLIKEKAQLQQQHATVTQEVLDLREVLNWKDRRIEALERQRNYGIVNMEETAHSNAKNTSMKRHSELECNGEVSVTRESSPFVENLFQGLDSGPESVLDVRIRTLLEEKKSLQEEVCSLRTELEKVGAQGVMERRETANGLDLAILDNQRDANKQISEYKMKLSKAEQEITTVGQTVLRLEAQLKRQREAAETAEAVEDELKADRRRLQRELRIIQEHVQELELTNGHLSRRLEKLKASRSTLLSQQ
uniref:leucine-rich repeat flightless-interacting protein 2-like isoform X1 n=1 Tax=Myxine glutinosa TaxID=7769 RepID=UPI00358F21F3